MLYHITELQYQLNNFLKVAKGLISLTATMELEDESKYVVLFP